MPRLEPLVPFVLGAASSAGPLSLGIALYQLSAPLGYCLVVIALLASLSTGARLRKRSFGRGLLSACGLLSPVLVPFLVLGGWYG